MKTAIRFAIGRRSLLACAWSLRKTGIFNRTLTGRLTSPLVCGFFMDAEYSDMVNDCQWLDFHYAIF
jgi:hypothetical protein